MNRKIHLAALWLLLAGTPALSQTGRTWSPGRLHRPRPPAHNIQLRRARLNAQSSATDVKEAKAGLLPTLSAAVTQSVQYRPFQEQTGNFVNGSIASSSSHKVTQSGSYGINASWVVWNGGKTELTSPTELTASRWLNCPREAGGQLHPRGDCRTLCANTVQPRGRSHEPPAPRRRPSASGPWP